MRAAEKEMGNLSGGKMRRLKTKKAGWLCFMTYQSFNKPELMCLHTVKWFQVLLALIVLFAHS